MRELSKRSFVFDSMLSFMAFAFPVFALHFFVQPGMARVYFLNYPDGALIYGLALTTLAVVQFFDSSFIGALSNVRLLQSSCNEAKGDDRGGLLFLLIVVLAVTSFFLLVIQVLGGSFSLQEYLLTVAMMSAMSVFDYLLIEFRVRLEYGSIVLSNVALVVGYGVGFIVFCYVHAWQLIYLIGYLSGLLCICWKLRTSLFSSPVEKPNLGTFLKYIKLLGSNIMSNLVSYGDRIILFPLMGAGCVSLYASAAVASKAVSFVTTPLNSVLLSYLVRIDQIKLSYRRIAGIFGVLLASMTIVYCCFLPISGLLSSLLYPQWSEDANQYIAPIVLAATLSAFSGCLNSLVLRYCKSGYQVLISGIRLVIYFLGTITLTFQFGLLGFCWASIGAELTKFILVLSISCTRGISFGR